MPVIHIFGASGSGTSTLGCALHEQFNYVHMDTDDYFWKQTNPPFTKKRAAKDRLRFMSQDIAKSNKIVISGSLCGWGDALIPKFDLLIRLDVPTDIRISRLEKREFQRFGERICEDGDMYDHHQKFLQWASEYDTGDISMRSNAMHDEWQSKIYCRQMCLDGTAPIDELLNEITKCFRL